MAQCSNASDPTLVLFHFQFYYCKTSYTVKTTRFQKKKKRKLSLKASVHINTRHILIYTHETFNICSVKQSVMSNTCWVYVNMNHENHFKTKLKSTTDIKQWKICIYCKSPLKLCALVVSNSKIRACTMFFFILLKQQKKKKKAVSFSALGLC